MECVRAISDPISYIRGARVNANALAVEYVIKNNLEGDIIEIGVWKGGSIVIMLLTLERLGIGNKHVHLYDTFEGMTPCTDSDIDLGGRRASDLIAQDPRLWLAVSALQEVQDNIAKHTKYPSSLIHYHQGDICKNTHVPDKIAFLRLDTDWYESTKCELEQFYDRVVPDGIIIIDDYGHWQGCRKAVDEFLKDKPAIKIAHIDYTGIYFVKP